MSDQTEVKQEFPSQLFITISGNHPMAEAALGSVLSNFFNEKGIAGRRQNAKEFDADFAIKTVNDLAGNQNNTVNVMATTLTLTRMQGQFDAWEYPRWGDASQPWTALVNDQLRNLWPTLSAQQKRAIYESFNALDIQVEGEDEPMSLEHALSIISSDNTETYIDFRGTHPNDHWDEVVVDGRPDAAELHAILFLMENSIPGKDGKPTHRMVPSSAPEAIDTPELQPGENPAQNGAHTAPELPDGREVPGIPADVAPAAGPEHHPEKVQLDDGVPTVKESDPSLAVNVPKSNPMSVAIDQLAESSVRFEAAQTGLSYASPTASGSVFPYIHNALED